MSHESDGVMESIGEKTRVAVMIAAQLADRAARARREHLQRRRLEDARAAEQLQARMAVEREAAVRAVSVVDDPRWWETATPKDVGDMYERARAWRGEDSKAAAAAELMEKECLNRYGIDVTNLAKGNTEAVLGGLAEAARERGDADRLRAQSERDAEVATLMQEQAAEYDKLAQEAAARVDAMRETATFQGAPDGFVDAAPDLHQSGFEVGPDGLADRTPQAQARDEVLTEFEDHARMAGHAHEGVEAMKERSSKAQQAAAAADARAAVAEEKVAGIRGTQEVPWDSAERRAAFAASLEGKVAPEVADARLTADMAQATPPQAAVSKGAGKVSASKARPEPEKARERTNTVSFR